MSSIATKTVRGTIDHFEPEAEMDLTVQRKMRGYLEQIDYAAYAANREIVGRGLSHTNLERFKHLAVAAAKARTRWVAAATDIAERSSQLTPDEVGQLRILRDGFEELAAAYEAMRRMVERGYLQFK